jgi:hypothetical protein
LQYEKKNEDYWDTTNSGKPWSDEELTVILSAPPTQENCIRYARLFRRGYGSIEQIYRWAATSNEVVDEKRPDNTFIQQIRLISKRLGWRT